MFSGYHDAMLSAHLFNVFVIVWVQLYLEAKINLNYAQKNKLFECGEFEWSPKISAAWDFVSCSVARVAMHRRIRRITMNWRFEVCEIFSICCYVSWHCTLLSNKYLINGVFERYWLWCFWIDFWEEISISLSLIGN